MIISMPLIRPEDYPAFRKLAPDNPDFPESYDQWLYWRIQYAANEEGHGHRVKYVEVRPSEFELYCRERNKCPNSMALDWFASEKAQTRQS
jgi:hypothetical protein